MTDEFEEKEATGIDVVRQIVEECEMQGEENVCNCIREKVKLIVDASQRP